MTPSESQLEHGAGMLLNEVDGLSYGGFKTASDDIIIRGQW